MEGRFDDQFVVDVFQTGSGTATNMNMNEVIAHNLLQSIKLLSSAAKVFTNKCIRGISANRSATTRLH